MIYCALPLELSRGPRGPRLLYRRGVPLVVDPGRVPVNAGQLRGESLLGAIPFAPPPWVPVASPRQRVCRLDAVLPNSRKNKGIQREGADPAAPWAAPERDCPHRDPE